MPQNILFYRLGEEMFVIIMSSPGVKPLHTKPLYTWMYDVLHNSVQGEGEGERAKGGQ